MKVVPPLNPKQRIILSIFVPVIIIVIWFLLSNFPYEQSHYGRWESFWITLIIVLSIITLFELLLFNKEENDYLRKAENLLKKEQYKPAINYFTKAIKLDLNNSYAFIKRGIAYSKVGKPDLSISDLNKALELNDQLDEAYFYRGILINNKHLAILEYNKAININSFNYEYYASRGWAFFTINNMDAAINDFNKSIEINAEYDKAYCYRAIAYKKLNKSDEALSDLNHAIKISPDNAQYYIFRLDCYIDMQDRGRALVDYEKITSLQYPIPQYVLDKFVELRGY